MIALSTFKKILERNEERLPLLTLDDFFNGNTAEDSIAPNQWGFGRPTLSEMWNMLQRKQWGRRISSCRRYNRDLHNHFACGIRKNCEL